MLTMPNTFAEKEGCVKGDYSWLAFRHDLDVCAYLSKHPKLAEIIHHYFYGSPKDVAAVKLGTFNQVTMAEEVGKYGIITTEEEFSKFLQGRPLPQINFEKYSCLFVVNRSRYGSAGVCEIKEFPRCMRIIIRRISEDIPIGGGPYTALHELPKTDKKIIFVVLSSVQGKASCSIHDGERVIFENELKNN